MNSPCPNQVGWCDSRSAARCTAGQTSTGTEMRLPQPPGTGASIRCHISQHHQQSSTIYIFSNIIMLCCSLVIGSKHALYRFCNPSSQMNCQTILRAALQGRPLPSLRPIFKKRDGLYLDQRSTANDSKSLSLRLCSQTTVRGNLIKLLVMPK